MTIRIAHSAEPREGSKSYWNWEAWIDGDASELDAIDHVEYRLHESYPRPNRISKSRNSRFKISSYGWGEFRLYATVQLKDQSQTKLEHWISFSKDGPKASRELKRVFMSFAASDSRVAQESRSVLEAAGIEVVSPEDLKTGLPWQIALRDEIESSDAMIVITPETANTAINTEVSIALESHKTIIPVSFAFRDNETPHQLSGTQELRIKDTSEIPTALQFLKDG